MEENATPLQEAIHNAEFAEGHAYGVYMIYAGILREAGMVEGAMKLEELANNEKEHLERWLVKQDIDLEPSAIMARVIQMELNDSHHMYTDMLKLVQKYAPDRQDLLVMVQDLIQIENRHAGLISDLKRLYEGTASRKEIEETRKGKWVCPHCGNFYYSKDEIPDKCPVCDHDKDEYVWQEG